MNELLLIGFSVILGIFGGKILQKFKIPQVVGFILVGVILGKSILGFFPQETIDSFFHLISFTLGIIGFMIGAELKGEVFKKYGWPIYSMLIGEGILAFLFVCALVTLFTGKLYLGLLLGAIASATDPASTINVLWEYRAKGPLTTILTSIVALDDGLAIVLYGLVSVFSKAMIAHESFSFAHSMIIPLFEIFQCFVLGSITAFLFVKVISKIKEKETITILTLALIAAVVGISIHRNIDLILSTMILGAFLTNMIPDISEKIFKTVGKTSSILYILFFVIVGAGLDVKVFTKASVLIIIIAYLLGRSFGKIIGSMLGGVISKVETRVARYTGLCLFTQGGVAIGLAMAINHNLSNIGEQGALVGSMVVSVVAATTFVVQLIGPIFVKIGITKADEIFRNITEDDIIDISKVKDFMNRNFSSIKESDTLDKIMDRIKEQESYHFPVIDAKGNLSGLLSLGNLRNVFRESQLDSFILAKDLASSLGKILYQDQPLREAFDIFNKRELDYLPVVEDKNSKKVVGIIEYYHLVELVNRRLIERQQNIGKDKL